MIQLVITFHDARNESEIDFPERGETRRAFSRARSVLKRARRRMSNETTRKSTPDIFRQTQTYAFSRIYTLIHFNCLHLHNATPHVALIRRTLTKAIVACKLASADNHR